VDGIRSEQVDAFSSVCLDGIVEIRTVVLRRKMTRETLITFASKLPACMVAMKARCGAYFVSGVLPPFFHEPGESAWRA